MRKQNRDGMHTVSTSRTAGNGCRRQTVIHHTLSPSLSPVPEQHETIVLSSEYFVYLTCIVRISFVYLSCISRVSLEIDSGLDAAKTGKKLRESGFAVIRRPDEARL